ncbi:hypothetical protein QR680_008733 [Steinernema hermaphroditum]|uniref:Uncharacterized protein n=1 Tax=Steinernema hermaphroditum TaxID=289476 RepID=A0AA39IHR0_9BILA|nr:hypothetical protein QR680_008733 [Steinernema hermaphroditum]
MGDRQKREVDVAKLCLLFIGLLIIGSILFISFRMRRCHLYKIYTIALFSAYVPAEVTHPIVLLIYGTQNYNKVKMEWPERLFMIFKNFSHAQYEMNSLIFLLLALIMYSNLSFAKTTVYEHNFPFIFAAGYGTIILLVTVWTILNGFLISYPDSPPEALPITSDILEYVIQSLRAVPYTLIWILVAASILKLIWDWKTHRKIADKRLFSKNRELLISAICFLLLPQILHFPVVVSGCLDTYRATVGPHSMSIAALQFHNSLRKWSIYAKQFRIVILSLCTVVAFRPYRTMIFGCRIRSISVVPMEGPTHSHPSYF